MIDVKTSLIYDFLVDETIAKSCESYYSDDVDRNLKHYSDCYGLPCKFDFSLGFQVDAGGLEVKGAMIDNCSMSNWSQGYVYDKKDAVQCKGRCIFIGYICANVWGHAITDSLTHLWWFNTDEYKNYFSDLKIYYWSEKPLEGSFLELIELAGVPLDKLCFLNEITHFENVIVPGDCLYRCERNKLLYTRDYVNIVDKILTGVKLSKSKFDKIYLIRPNESRQYTCLKVYNILDKKGFVKIIPTDYSLCEQLDIFHNAKEIVVEESSLSHNLIFCKPGTKVTILRKTNYINEYQVVVNEMRSLNVRYVDCHLSVYAIDGQMAAGPFFIYANKLFCDAFGVEYEGFPYKEFRKWLKNGYFLASDVNSPCEILKWSDEYVSIFVDELTYSRKLFEKKFRWIKRIPIVNIHFKDRAFRWIIKRKMRSLM